MNKRRLIIIALIILFIVLPVVSFFVFGNSRSNVPQETDATYTDKDTGETVTSYAGIQPEGDGNPGILFLGVGDLNSDVMREQFLLIRSSVETYVSNNLAGKFGSVTLLPKSYKLSGNKMTGQLRLGQTNDTVSISVVGLKTASLRVTITDPTGKYGNYDSGVVLLYGD